MSPVVLVADIGGTHARLALVQGRRILAREQVQSASLGGDAAPWLNARARALQPAPVAIGVALAGPVEDPERVELTNLALALRRADLRLPAVLVNDLHAAMSGLDMLEPGDQVELGGEAPRRGGPCALLGVGTGLGEAVALGEAILPGEGGHGAWAPQDEREEGLLRWLRQRQGYVDWEHVASGSALPGLYAYARALHPAAPPAPEGAEAAFVLAEAERQPAARLALELMLGALGREAGNLALRHLCSGGVYLMGGVAVRLRPWLAGPVFRRAFEERGRFSNLARRIPRRLVLDEDLGLRGAARLAARGAGVADPGGGS